MKVIFTAASRQWCHEVFSPETSEPSQELFTSSKVLVKKEVRFVNVKTILPKKEYYDVLSKGMCFTMANAGSLRDRIVMASLQMSMD